jgi:hypothetical protein
MSKSKSLKDEIKKDYEPCTNYIKCNGKWFKYKAKGDAGFCKVCIKVENEKFEG